MKDIFVNDIKDLKGKKILEASFMVMKKLSKEDGKLIAYIGDKTGDIKASIPDKDDVLNVGDVILVKKNNNDRNFLVDEFKKEDKFDMEDFIPTIDRPMVEIMNELNQISEEEFKSKDVITLDKYFFKDEVFLEKFKKGIGGLKQHHNYRGGLAEHTLNVMYMAKVMAYRYDCRYKEIAILAAKLHDIGKIEEYFTDGPFAVTMRGEMEGHIVIGTNMLEEAFRAGGNIYSEDFKYRIKGCMVQHHGKVEYGSPKAASSEEAFIVNFADNIDAVLNKISQVKQITEPNTWSEYDRRIGTRLYM
ncbi:HD domain-containing protein [Clostridium aestuarii]|uniref:HD domain-containing protein n=1 Tax=Clostridium aestuarii TaxID=338193 RepID=A0ABT4CYD8_9CLOT|nr:HD domain-containing protein [Clostridium aestuarii]MCY6483125.1 HD domain-containing protein [Clostridium aestuarii]